MQLPVDVSKLMEEVANIDEAKSTPLSISILLDETAPADCIAYVRSTFASDAPALRLTVAYLNGRPFTPYPADDMAVIVAGMWEGVGATAQALRDAGVPVMVVTTMPSLVKEMAEAYGNPIPDGDLVSPASPGSIVTAVTGKVSDATSMAVDSVALAAKKISSIAAPDSKVSQVIANFSDSRKREEKPVVDFSPQAEPFELTSDLRDALDQRMGEWVLAACQEKKLALSLAFPFTGRSMARDAVSITALENAGIGLLPVVPAGADLPLMTLNQAKMVLQIAAAYGYPMTADRAAEIVTVVATAFLSRGLARTITRVIPPFKVVASTGIGYAATMVLGTAMIEYYEGGDSATGMGGAINTALGAGGTVAEGVKNIAFNKMDEAGIDKTAVMARVGEVATKVAGAAAGAAGTAGSAKA